MLAVCPQTPLQALSAQLGNGAFMASLAPGPENALGEALVATHNCLAAPTDDPVHFAATLAKLEDAFRRINGADGFVHGTTGIVASQDRNVESLEPAEISDAKEKIVIGARALLDPRLDILAEMIAKREAGIPLFRPGIESFIHDGYQPGALRALMDRGVIGRKMAQSLSNNLQLNAAMLDNFEQDARVASGTVIHKAVPGFIGVSLGLVLLLGAASTTFMIGAGIPLVLGAALLYASARGDSGLRALKKTIGLPWSTDGRRRLDELKNRQSLLRQAFEEVFGGRF